jgi:hypothetical protein
MAQSILQKIEELSEEREKILAREGRGHAESGDHERLGIIDHDLQVLWDLRRRELAGEPVDLNEDYYDRYDRYTGSDGPGT